MAYNFNPYSQSGAVLDYKRKQDAATGTYNSYANRGYSSGAGGLGSEVKTAQDRLNALYQNNNLSQQFKYSKEKDYNAALKNISDRKAFQYDLSQDMLFQQAKDQYQAMGKTAMADTIGQASAMTGGYGNSYATTAGAQAYNAYLQELNNSIGDYYAMAMSAYNNETDRLNSVYSAYSADRGTEANEWGNNWNVYNSLYNQYYNQYSDMLNKDMSAWQQKGSNLYNAANLATNQYSTASSNDINIWNSQEQLRAQQASQIETERANRAEEKYRNDSLEETIRSNKANEAYSKAKAELEAQNSTVTPQSSKKTGELISKIFGEADVQRFLPKDKKKDTASIAQEIIDDALKNDEITAGEAAYLYDYYSLTTDRYKKS